MKFLQETSDSTVENLAIDEVLLDWMDGPAESMDVLRLWENTVYAVVLGRSSKVADEVNVAYCQTNSIPIYRRSSGGTAVVIGPGCLMYSLILRYDKRPELRMLDKAHEFVMKQMCASLESLGLAAKFQGTCDLTLEEKKFSGNSLRCKRNALLYHGTLLNEFPLALIQNCLIAPPRQPDYRLGRSHMQFVTNLEFDATRLQQAIRESWNAQEPLEHWPKHQVAELARTKYESDAWTMSR